MDVGTAKPTLDGASGRRPPRPRPRRAGRGLQRQRLRGPRHGRPRGPRRTRRDRDPRRAEPGSGSARLPAASRSTNSRTTRRSGSTLEASLAADGAGALADRLAARCAGPRRHDRPPEPAPGDPCAGDRASPGRRSTACAPRLRRAGHLAPPRRGGPRRPPRDHRPALGAAARRRDPPGGRGTPGTLRRRAPFVLLDRLQGSLGPPRRADRPGRLPRREHPAQRRLRPPPANVVPPGARGPCLRPSRRRAAGHRFGCRFRRSSLRRRPRARRVHP